MARDMTRKQFDDACQRHGFERDFLGYYRVGGGLHIYAGNAGSNRRAQLAYLIREKEKHNEKAEGH